jgi:hypothetical protein
MSVVPAMKFLVERASSWAAALSLLIVVSSCGSGPEIGQSAEDWASSVAERFELDQRCIREATRDLSEDQKSQVVEALTNGMPAWADSWLLETYGDVAGCELGS